MSNMRTGIVANCTDTLMRNTSIFNPFQISIKISKTQSGISYNFWQEETYMIIGLGFKARAGKDTVAAHLVNNYSFIQESFAYPLKEYIGREICGFNDKQLYGAWKETVDPEWEMTPRQMLQLIGTDALRKVVHDNFWVIPMKRKLKEHIRNGRHVVISDVRFLNEVSMIRSLNGLLVKVDRTNLDKITGFEKHSSEFQLESYDAWDFKLDNNGTLDELYHNVDEMMKQPNYHNLTLNGLI